MNDEAYGILHGTMVDETLLPWDAIYTVQPARTADLYLSLRIDRVGEYAHRNPFVLARLEPDNQVLEICEIMSILLRGENWPAVEFTRLKPLFVRLVIFWDKGMYTKCGCVITKSSYGEIADKASDALKEYRNKVVDKYGEKGDNQ